MFKGFFIGLRCVCKHLWKVDARSRHEVYKQKTNRLFSKPAIAERRERNIAREQPRKNTAKCTPQQLNSWATIKAKPPCSHKSAQKSSPQSWSELLRLCNNNVVVMLSVIYNFGPAATRALPASLPSYFLKFLMKRPAKSLAFSSH